MTLNTVTVRGGLTLKLPIVASAGCVGWGEVLYDLIDPLALGAVVTPTVTVDARVGTQGSRTAETTGGLLYNTGLPNPGLADFCSGSLPSLARHGCPVIVSVAGSTESEWRQLGVTLNSTEHVSALEANVAALCPPHIYCDRPALVSFVASAVRVIRNSYDGTLLIKLPGDSYHIATLAEVATREGADALVVGHSARAAAVRWTGKPTMRFGGEGGFISGPAIKPLNLLQTQLAAGATVVPLFGGGGIMTAQDAMEYFTAGADVVALGMICLVSPNAVNQFAHNLTAALEGVNVSSPGLLCQVKRPVPAV